MKTTDDRLTIGEVAGRAGVATSALRFYEQRGLIESERTDGNQRRYRRSVLRRVALIRAAQGVGLTLTEIEAALATLPRSGTASARDWARLASGWREDLDARIRTLVGLRDNLSSCIGCGCLSVDKCALFNPDDRLAGRGSGAHLLPGG